MHVVQPFHVKSSKPVGHWKGHKDYFAFYFLFLWQRCQHRLARQMTLQDMSCPVGFIYDMTSWHSIISLDEPKVISNRWMNLPTKMKENRSWNHTAGVEIGLDIDLRHTRAHS